MRWIFDAYAKLNWTLDVLARREDGYHEMETLMQSLSLRDTLHIEPARTFSLQIVGNQLPAAGENLVLKAARALQEASGEGALAARFTLVKRIPVAAGLGGGSADAAAALVGLDHVWGLGWSEARLMDLAVRIGADVPFCIRGGLALARGIGEKLDFHAQGPVKHLVVMKPCPGVSTREVFTALALDRVRADMRPRTEGALAAIRRGELHALKDCMGNVLEHVTVAMRPRIAQALDDLLYEGAVAARMSGSGPSVFGVFADETASREACERLRGRYPQCWHVTTVERGVSMRAAGRPNLR